MRLFIFNLFVTTPNSTCSIEKVAKTFETPMLYFETADLRGGFDPKPSKQPNKRTEDYFFMNQSAIIPNCCITLIVIKRRQGRLKSSKANSTSKSVRPSQHSYRILG